MKMRRSLVILCACSLAAANSLLGNGGAWPTGVPSTGNAAPSDKARSTDVAVEEESLTIDLHQEFAAVEVRYRMRNTGAKVVQDFFFPVERWVPEESGPDGDAGKPADLENYSIKADGTELKSKTINVPAPTRAQEEPTPEESPTLEPTDGEAQTEADAESEEPEDGHRPFTVPNDLPPPTKHWRKSEIPFNANQAREVVIRYRVRYSGYEHFVSDDSHETDELLVYSLSPAATWKGPIGRGRIVVNVRHPRPEEVAIERPQNRFQKISEVRYEWEFRDLEPTLADDIRIVARRGLDSYYAGNPESSEDQAPREYVFQGERYFLVHGDYEAVASSTLRPSGKHNYEIKNIKRPGPDLAWCEGVEGDGLGESITFDVARPLPLDAILIRPGYDSMENASLWAKNNRLAELEVTLNGEHTFTTRIPDERFSDPYPIVVRDYTQPVKTVKLVIKGVHRGTAARDTCISEVRMKGKLATKPKVNPAR